MIQFLRQVTGLQTWKRQLGAFFPLGFPAGLSVCQICPPLAFQISLFGLEWETSVYHDDFFRFFSMCNFPVCPFLTETNHCGPSGVQWGALPSLPGGAPWEHYQWCCPYGWLLLHTWWPQGAHRGRMQFCAPGSSGSSVWVHGQCKSYLFFYLLCNAILSAVYQQQLSFTVLITWWPSKRCGKINLSSYSSCHHCHKYSSLT